MRIPPKEELLAELAKTEFASCLTQKDIEKLDKSIKFLSYAKGENIYKQGASITEYALLLTGLCKLTVENPTNDLGTIVSIQKPVSIIGLTTLFDDTYRATAAALSDSIVVFFDKKDFLQIAKENAKCAFTLFRYSAKAINNHIGHLADLGQKSIKARLASTILNLAKFEGNDFINLPISRNDLAEISGIATGSTIRLLSDLEKENVIVLEKKSIRIKDKAKLYEISIESEE